MGKPDHGTVFQVSIGTRCKCNFPRLSGWKQTEIIGLAYEVTIENVNITKRNTDTDHLSPHQVPQYYALT